MSIAIAARHLNITREASFRMPRPDNVLGTARPSNTTSLTSFIHNNIDKLRSIVEPRHYKGANSCTGLIYVLVPAFTHGVRLGSCQPYLRGAIDLAFSTRDLPRWPGPEKLAQIGCRAIIERSTSHGASLHFDYCGRTRRVASGQLI